MTRSFDILFDQRGRFLIGFFNTLWVCLLSGTLSLGLSTVLVLALMSKSPAVRHPLKLAVDGMRCIPFLLLAYLLYYGLPSVSIRMSNWATAIVALVIYNTAYFAEILRGAWLHLPPEQEEAARAYGYSGLRLFIRIIGPQVFISAGPILGNQVIQIIKDSAFLMIITVPEITYMADYVQSTYFVPFASFLLAMFLYWVLCRGVEILTARLEYVAARVRYG